MSFLIQLLGRNGSSGVYASYWSNSDLLGPTIATAVQHARDELELNDVHPAMATSTDQGPPDDGYETSASGLWCFRNLHTWSLGGDELSVFRFPCGVLPTGGESGIDLDDVTEAFKLHPAGDYIEAVVDDRRIRDVFTALFHGLPSRDGFEVCLFDHWLVLDQTEVWIGHPRYQDDEILSYLVSNEDSLLRNGGVAVATYSRSAGCTLRLTEHKLITLSAPESGDILRAAQQLRDLGLDQRDEIASIAIDCHHLHYAPVGSLSPTALRTQLHQDDFRHVDTQNGVRGKG